MSTSWGLASALQDYIFETVCLSVDCVIFGTVYYLYRHSSALTTGIKNAPLIELDDDNLVASIRQHPCASRNTEGHFIPYAVMRGKVAVQANTEPLRSTYLPDLMAVIKQNFITEHKRTYSRTGFWFDTSRTINLITNDVPFYLIPRAHGSIAEARGRAVEVTEFIKAARLDMDITFDAFEETPKTFSGHFLGYLLGDRQTGIQTTEQILRCGTTLTAIGEVVCSPDGKVIIQSPSNGQDYFLCKDSVNSLIEELCSRNSRYRVILYLCGTLGLFIVSWTAYKYWSRAKQQRFYRNNQDRLRQIINDPNRPTVEPSADSPAEIGRPEDQTSANQLCVVCYTHAREVILLDCGHVCLCAQCALQVFEVQRACPMCRAHIDRVMPAFLS